MGRAVAFALSLCAASTCWPATAGAQSPQTDGPTDADRQAASERFTAGVEAAREDEWERARQAFAQAYEHVRRPEILVNLARAQVETGRLVDAATSYERFLEQTDGATADGAEELRAKAERALERVRERIPRLRIDGAREGDTVRVAGEDHAVAGDEPVEIAVDPGRHEVVLRRDGRVMARSEVRVEEGEDKEVVLVAPVTPEGEASTSPDAFSEAEARGGAPAEPGEPAPSGGSTWLRSPWLWIGVGAVVLGLGGLAIGLAAGGGSDRVAGNTDPPILRVR